ncbi:MAG TPA: hypothetical protein VNY31_08345 [Solirubrobacteraceae bacterium]|nr:hypothetical protein [Solirubrobacteraceae bacterium]
MIETVLSELRAARDSCDNAVDALRSIDAIEPAQRRQLVGALDDLLAEAQRIGGALNRLGERSEQNAAVRPDPAGALLGAPE